MSHCSTRYPAVDPSQSSTRATYSSTRRREQGEDKYRYLLTSAQRHRPSRRPSTRGSPLICTRATLYSQHRLSNMTLLHPLSLTAFLAIATGSVSNDQEQQYEQAIIGTVIGFATRQSSGINVPECDYVPSYYTVCISTSEMMLVYPSIHPSTSLTTSSLHQTSGCSLSPSLSAINSQASALLGLLSVPFRHRREWQFQSLSSPCPIPREWHQEPGAGFRDHAEAVQVPSLAPRTSSLASRGFSFPAR